MKQLVEAVLVGAVLFMVTAIVQERATFFGGSAGRPALAEADRAETEEEVVAAVRQFLAIAGHVYQSRGDTRFVERLPATEEVTAELLDDVRYLDRNGRVQTNQLTHLEIREVRLRSPARAEVQTSEYWVVGTIGIQSGQPVDPVRSQIVATTYWLEREGVDWRVARWDLVDAPPSPSANRSRGD